MKVLHLIGGGDTGGAKTHILNLVKELSTKIDVHLVCFMKAGFSEDAEKMGIPITVIESGNPFFGVREMKKIMKDEKIDIIHCHGARGNLMGVMMRKYLNAPIVTTVHSDYRLDYLGRPAARLGYGTINTIALRMIDYYICVAEAMGDILIERNFHPEEIYQINNSLDFSTQLEFSSREEFFKSIDFDVKENDVVGGIAARLTPIKDHTTLLRAMAEVCKTSDNFKLVIAGDGEDKEKLMALAKELKIDDKICFAGWVKDVNSFYNAIDINILSSISEGFPYALIEGARQKTATVSSRFGTSVPALIDHKRNGFIFEPRNYNELAEYLTELINNKEMRVQMGIDLYKKAAENFSLDRMVSDQIDIYESVIRRHNRKKTKKRDGIIICGAYGYGNAGDDAILKSIISSVKDMDEDMPVTVIAKNTQKVKNKFRVNSFYTFNIFSMINSMRKSLVYINGGGSLIQNITSSRSLLYYLFTIRLASLLKNKVSMYGCGIGPVNGDRNIKKVTKSLNSSADVITLREINSYEELKSYGVNKPQLSVTSDPAFVLKPASKEDAEAYLHAHGLSENGKYLCLALRTWYGYTEKAKYIAETADYIYEKYGLTTVFISMNIMNDIKAAKEISKYMKTPFVILEDQAEPELLISVLSYMQAVVSMRLHALIFAAISGVPIVGVSYDPKINNVLEYLGYGECINLDDVDENNLRIATEKAVLDTDNREKLKQYADKLAEKEKENIASVKALLLKQEKEKKKK